MGVTGRLYVSETSRHVYLRSQLVVITSQRPAASFRT